MIQFTLPIYWTKKYKTKKDKTILVGINWYRNAHYFDQNNFKKDFELLIKNQLKDTTITLNQFIMEYELYYKNPNCDPSNIIALIEKVSLDALQELNIIKNDNIKYHTGSVWKVVNQDKKEPRCVVYIKKR